MIVVDLKRQWRADHFYVCTICHGEHTSTSLDNYVTHMIEVHSKRAQALHPCPQCSHVTTFPGKLQEHLALHANPDVLLCEKCHFRTTSFHGIRRHRASCRGKVTGLGANVGFDISGKRSQQITSFIIDYLQQL